MSLELSDNAINVYKKLYFTKEENLPTQTHERVANAIADTPEFKKEIHQALDENAIRPNSPVLINAGVKNNPQLTACFVTGLDDDLRSILKANYDSGIIFSNGSGLGYPIYKLREKDATISHGGYSSGANSFLYVYAETAERIKSGGRARRCLPKGSKIYCKDKIKPIEEAKITDLVMTSNGYYPITNIFNQGIQKTIIINTQNGQFECTPNHKMAVFDGFETYKWKNASDLTIDDRLVFNGVAIEGQYQDLPTFTYEKPNNHSTTCKNITIPKLDTDISWFLGYFFGNGYVYLKDTMGHISISIPKNQPEIPKKIQDCFSLFNCSSSIEYCEGEWLNIKAHSKQLALYLSQYKLPKQDLIIPNIIKNNTIEIRSAFIAGLFDADGYNGRPLKILSTVYKTLNNDVIDIMQSLGIPVKNKLQCRQEENWQNLYHIDCPYALGMKRFERYIKPYSFKYHNIRKCDFYRSHSNDLTFDNNFFELSDLRDKDVRGKWSKTGNQAFGASTYERVIKKDLHLLPIKIISIEEGRYIETYDIEVHEKHEFICNGLLTHNSAILAMSHINHPDIEEFITIKNGTDQRLRSMNLSIAITDEFMQAVKDDKDWNLIGVKDKQIKKTVKARELWNKIISNAHKTGDPAPFFIDRANIDNAFYPDEKIESCNVCGEQSLLPFGSCNLITINLNNCITNNQFDFEKLKYYTRLCVRFTDNAIDLTGYPTDDYKKSAELHRPIGCGLMGLADVLIKLNIPYDSLEGIKLAGEIMRNITKHAIIMSSELALEKGVFPLYEQYKDNLLKIASKFFDLNNPKEQQEFEIVYKNGLRNSQWSTIAPNGSTALSADCSTGLEPLFALVYEKHISDSNEIWYFVNKEFENRYSNFEWYNDAIKQIAKEKGSCQNVPYLDKHSKRVFVTAHDIHWKDRLLMQEALQKGCSNSLSVTINLPHDTTKETISDIYMSAWEKRLKGLTIFRDGSLEFQPITFGKTEQKEEVKNECKMPEIYKKELLDIERAERHRCKWKNANVYINVSLDDEDMPIELFTKLPKEVGINGNGIFNPTVYMERQSNWDLISRLISLALRYSVPLDDIINQCDKSKISMVDAAGILSRVLKAYIPIEEIDDIEEYIESYGIECPECKQKTFVHEGGCKICYSCNFSQCG